MTCPGCHHAPHAGRCPVFYHNAWSGYCRCPEREEIPDDGDSVLDATQPGRPVGGVPAVHDLAQRHLTACRTELADIATDILAQTRAIGRTMIEGAARMRGEADA